MSALRRPRLAAVVAAVAAALAAVLAAATAGVASPAQSRAATVESALAAARQVAVDFSSYDYRHIAEDFKRVLDESTGEFHQQFLTQSTGAQQLIVEGKASSTGQVASAGISDASATSAVAVLAVTRTLHGGEKKSGQDSFGMEITLVRQGDRWLASKVVIE